MDDRIDDQLRARRRRGPIPAAAPPRRRRLLHDTRGASLPDSMFVIAIIALGGIAAMKAVRGSIGQTAHLLGIDILEFREPVQGDPRVGTTLTGVPTGPTEVGRGDDRDRDPRNRDRSDRRARTDERTPDRTRNPTGRDGSWLENDWAGREILGRYLAGGDDWNIRDDDRWTQYMTEDPLLTGQVSQQTQGAAQQLYQQYVASGVTRAPLDITFHADIENGEGINGHQYLHGTNADVGDFHIGGNATITPRADGGYDVTIDGEYAWNDVIDPNDQYSTDTQKSRIAEIITAGQADPYKIQILWHKQTTIHLDAHGQVIGSEGWPS